MKKYVLFISLAIFLLAGGALAFFAFKPHPQPPKTNNTACTLDAKICWDGSSVSRVAPLCDFAPCPVNNTWKWVIDEDQAIQFQYPEELSTTYIHAQDWPPSISLSGGPLRCDESTQRTIGENVYCVDIQNEGAAGSTYTTYTYTTMKNKEMLTITFTLRYPQCANYDEDKRIACETEEKTFALDTLIDRIVQTLEPTAQGK